MVAKSDNQVRIGDDGDYIVHPYRVAVPEMSEERLLRLTARTKASGQRAPIMLDREGRILDGRAQLRACLVLGLKPKFETYQGDDPAWFVVGTMDRTPYTGAQCTLIAARLMPHLIREAAVRKTSGKKVEGKTKGRAAEIAAKAVGKTNAPYVALGVSILTERDDIAQLIDAGKIKRMAHAKALYELDVGKSQRAVKRIDAGKDPAIVLDKRSTTDDEWYTPAFIIEAVRDAFGGTIDCDPCSPGKKKSVVNAQTTYTKGQNGLNRRNPWPGNVFVNPPFSDTEPWIARAIEEVTTIDDGRKIYVLLPVHPEVEYQSTLIKAATNILLLADRVSFLKSKSKTKTTGRSSIMIVGLNASTQPLMDAGLDGIVMMSLSATQKEDVLDASAYEHLAAEDPEAGAHTLLTPDEEQKLHRLFDQVNTAEEKRIAIVRSKVRELKSPKK